MLFTVTYCQDNNDMISHTSNSQMEIYGLYIDFVQRSATLAAMVPNTFSIISMYNERVKLHETMVQSTKPVCHA